MKLLVHLHLYYLNQTDYFIERLKSLTVPFDFVVTMVQDDEVSKLKILHEFPNTRFLLVKNLGYDVYPFIQAMQVCDLNSYDYVLKLHTKNHRTNRISIHHIHYTNWELRDDLINPLIGSKRSFRKIFRKIQSPKIGIVCSRNFIHNQETQANVENTKLLCKDYNISYKSNFIFCAGTLFLCKTEMVKKVLSRPFNDDDFAHGTNTTGDAGTVAHSMETIFGAICSLQGLQICGVHNLTTFRKYMMLWLKAFVHFDLWNFLLLR